MSVGKYLYAGETTEKTHLKSKDTVGGRYQWFSPPTLHLISQIIWLNHAITIITNEFHKFWCLFDFRNNISKLTQNGLYLDWKAQI